MINFVLDLLFPPKCGFCGKINTDYLCKKCEIKLQNLKPKQEIQKIKKHNFSYHIYGYLYKAEIRSKIIDYKFNDKPELSHTLAKLLLNNKKICGFLENYDIIIPVPMYPKKQIQRGYNQSDLIAKELSKNVSIDYANDVLYKYRPTKMQSSLDKKSRQNNVKGAYNCKNQQKINGRRVILFDDIYTTGSTAEECSKVLKQSGASEIAVLTIAKD